MIILDTNVVSEMTRPNPSPAVSAWLDAQHAETLFLTSITVAEKSFGIAVLPAGRRRDALHAAFTQMMGLFAGRILSFDERSGLAYATLAAAARGQGKGFPTPDGYIAAIAVVHAFAVATRDESAFLAGSVEVINPWDYIP